MKTRNYFIKFRIFEEKYQFFIVLYITKDGKTNILKNWKISEIIPLLFRLIFEKIIQKG